ncbi:hypothetical protein [Candidatus Leptofilum sp.]
MIFSIIGENGRFLNRQFSSRGLKRWEEGRGLIVAQETAVVRLIADELR